MSQSSSKPSRDNSAASTPLASNPLPESPGDSEFDGIPSKGNAARLTQMAQTTDLIEHLEPNRNVQPGTRILPTQAWNIFPDSEFAHRWRGGYDLKQLMKDLGWDSVLASPPSVDSVVSKFSTDGNSHNESSSSSMPQHSQAMNVEQPQTSSNGNPSIANPVQAQQLQTLLQSSTGANAMPAINPMLMAGHPQNMMMAQSFVPMVWGNQHELMAQQGANMMMLNPQIAAAFQGSNKNSPAESFKQLGQMGKEQSRKRGRKPKSQSSSLSTKRTSSQAQHGPDFVSPRTQKWQEFLKNCQIKDFEKFKKESKEELLDSAQLEEERQLKAESMGLEIDINPAPRKRRKATSYRQTLQADQMRIASSILNDWFYEHLHNPYPTNAEKKQLQDITAMSIVQLNNWFGNKRVRVKKQIERVSYENSLKSNNTTATTALPKFGSLDDSDDEFEVVLRKKRDSAMSIEPTSTTTTTTTTTTTSSSKSSPTPSKQDHANDDDNDPLDDDTESESDDSSFRRRRRPKSLDDYVQ